MRLISLLGWSKGYQAELGWWVIYSAQGYQFLAEWERWCSICYLWTLYESKCWLSQPAVHIPCRVTICTALSVLTPEIDFTFDTAWSHSLDSYCHTVGLVDACNGHFWPVAVSEDSILKITQPEPQVCQSAIRPTNQLQRVACWFGSPGGARTSD